MALELVYDNKEDIPAAHAELFTEREGKWHLTEVSGMKTQADIDRLNTSLTKERKDHKDTKAKVATWAELGESAEKVKEQLDRIPELEIAANSNKTDEEKIKELAEKRADSLINAKTAPLEKELKKVQDELNTATELNTKLTGESNTRTIHDAIRGASTGDLKIREEAMEDALMLGTNSFEINEEGKVVTKDGIGVTPGVPPTEWLKEVIEKRPHWLPDSAGGGAKGSKGKGNGTNPWTKDNWNLTEQGKVIKEQGMEVANNLAKSAGSQVGAVLPPAKAA